MIGTCEYQQEDGPAVLALARLMQQEAPQYRNYPFEVERFDEWASLFLTNDDWLCVLAVDEEAGPIGMLAVGCVPMIFCSERTVDDVVFFVHPDWRGTTAALRMLRHMEPWAKARGATAIRMGVTTGTNPAQTIRFLDRFGYKLTGWLLTKPC